MQNVSVSARSTTATPPRALVPSAMVSVKARAAQPDDALAQGLAAQTPEIYKTSLIRVVSGAVETFNKQQRTKQRYELGQASKEELHAAEAAMDQANAQLKQLHDSVNGPKAMMWKAQGFDLEKTWRMHGLPLPKQPSDGHKELHSELFGIACAASLVTTFGSMAALYLLPSATTFFIAGPLALFSGLGGGALIAVRASSQEHAGEAPAERVRGLLDNPAAGVKPGSPEAYKDALIYLTAHTKMTQQQLQAVQGGANPDADLLRLAQADVTNDLLTLYALKAAVGEVKGAEWKLRGFDIEAAWKTCGMTLPPLASLKQDAVIPPLGKGVRHAMGYVMGLITIVFGAIGADMFNAGRLGGVAALAMRGVSSLFKIHVVLAMVVLGVAGFAAGGAMGSLLNKIVGTPSTPKPPKLN